MTVSLAESMWSENGVAIHMTQQLIGGILKAH